LRKPQDKPLGSMSSDNSYFAGLEFFAELFDDLASCLYIYDNPAYPHQISAVKFCTETKMLNLP